MINTADLRKDTAWVLNVLTAPAQVLLPGLLEIRTEVAPASG